MKCKSDSERDGLQKIIDKALREMELEGGGPVDLDRVNLAEFQRRTGLTRSRCRTIKEHGFRALPHGRTGQKATVTKLTGYESQIDDLLRSGVTNSEVCFDRLVGEGLSCDAALVQSRHLACTPLRVARRPGGRVERAEAP